MSGFWGTIILIAANAVSLTSVICACQVALSGHDGYCWFLLIAALALYSSKLPIKTSDTPDDED